ncbi:MAG TPA: type II toxin-antitoxin system PrlF family antitoxin [Azospirillaceae bacterium]|nr:type II toxin-antitoxin system PrlF family antitoxin [Azospirillaceae bacterium]
MAAYKGSITTTGASEALRLEKALFRQHPEFKQKAKLRAHVLGKGTLLVKVVDEEPEDEAERDPVVLAFLAFLEKDMLEHPERLIPLTEEDMRRTAELTKDVVVDDDEPFPDDVTFP